uniref:ATP-binding cassette domain-containing protein n=1 Tax=Aminivibrio sp. TaxID=1872489 RepID=UPI00345E240E
ILVSHDRAFLDGCVDHILSINRADIEVRKGNFSSWWRNRQQQDEAERAENERLKKDIGRMQEAARRASGWSDAVEKTKRGVRNSGLRPDRGYIGHKAAKMAQRSKSLERRRQEALEEKSALLRNVEEGEKLKLFPLAFHSPGLAELENVSVRYGDRTVCEGVSFAIGRGERIALRGRNGCGKSSILKLILGESLEYGGRLSVASGLKISWLPQDAEGLWGSLADYAQQSGIDRSLFLAILRKLDFSRTQFEKNLEDYSGGQKKKVLLARSLCEQAHLYLWDEPLNYIDVISRIQITELLLEHRPTMVFVEHDRAFCDEVSTRVVDL